MSSQAWSFLRMHRLLRRLAGLVAIGWFVASGSLLAGAVPATAASPTDYSAIDAYVAGSLAGSPGAVFSIVHGDQVVHVKGLGYADDHGTPMTGDTPLAIGSETKSLTALAIMQLSEKGSLSLDSPVQNYIPWFQVAQVDYSRLITVRELLQQTSGLPPSAPFDTPVTSVESRVRDLASVSLTAAPGRIYQYSNSNYNTLGVIIEAVSGLSYADYMAHNVFQPLAMTRTYASETEAENNGLGTGHQWWFGLPVETDTYRQDYVPAGYVLSSANDMSHFLIAQLNGGTYAGHSLLSARGINTMQQGVTHVATGGSYGMGWLSTTLDGTPVISHDGDSLNMHSDMILVPSTGWGVEVIANADSVPVLLSASVEAAAKGVISMLLGRPAPLALSPIATYALFDLLLLVLIGFQVWSMIRALGRRSREVGAGWVPILRKIVLPISWRLIAAAVALGAVWLLAAQLGSSVFLIVKTDIGLAIVAIGALLLVNGAIRSARAAMAMRARNQADVISESTGSAATA